MSRILVHDSAASAPATVIARKCNFLRGGICGFARGADFPQPRPRTKTECRCSPIKLYDNSIIHQSGFHQTVAGRIKEKTDAGTISRHPAMRHRAAVSK